LAEIERIFLARCFKRENFEANSRGFSLTIVDGISISRY
jgi:hypothetical protein